MSRASAKPARPGESATDGHRVPPALDLDDIQSGVLRPRPTPYAATFVVLRIDDPSAGRELVGRLASTVATIGHEISPAGDTWVAVALSFQGLRALGLPAESLDSFAPEFRQGMAARAEELWDVGPSAPAHWNRPFGTPDVHVVIAALAPDRERLNDAIERARETYRALPGIQAISRLDCEHPATGREPFGFRDGISHPAIEGAPIPTTNPRQPPLKAGEVVLGYPDETGHLPAMPWPAVLGRNGAYVALRMLHEDVAAFRRYLASNGADEEAQEILAAKMMGRWRSGAPLALSPDRDDPSLGADRTRNNVFLYDDDPLGFKCPLGSHIRRTNPRSTSATGGSQVNRHRMVRRGTVYGPPLSPGVLVDDGVDRGIIFVFIGASISRQFEFVQTEWINQGIFIGRPEEDDPMCGPRVVGDGFTIPTRPIRRRLTGLPQFVTTRGGEYLFMPGVRALRWLAEGDYAAAAEPSASSPDGEAKP